MKNEVIFFAILLVVGINFALADVEVRFKSNAEMGNIITMQMECLDNVKGDKNYSSVTTTIEGGMMAMLGKGKPMESVNITRLDRGLFWEVIPEKREYKEMTTEELKAKIAEGESENQEETDAGIDEEEYTWSVEIQVLPGTQNIGGFECKGIRGTATGVKKTDPADTVFVTNEQWLSDEVPGRSEMEAYHKRYTEVVGVDQMWARENMASMLKGYGAQFEQLSKEIGEQKGYPIKTAIFIESSLVENKEGSDGENQGMSEMMKKMFKGKDDENQAKSKSGRSKVFSLTNEVLSITETAIDDSRFEIPAGYKKK